MQDIATQYMYSDTYFGRYTTGTCVFGYMKLEDRRILIHILEDVSLSTCLDKTDFSGIC